MLLIHTRQETRNIDECDERDVERVAETDEPRRLLRGVDVEYSREVGGLICDDPDRMAGKSAETNDDVAGIERRHLEEGAIVDDQPDQLLHVVGFVRIVGNQSAQLGRHPVRWILRGDERRIFVVVLGNEREQ